MAILSSETSLLLHWQQQSPEVQRWLMDQYHAAAPKQDIQVVAYTPYTLGTTIVIYEVILPIGMQVERLFESQIAYKLQQLFHWSQDTIKDFIGLGCPLWVFIGSDGTKMYYVQPLDADMAMIAFEH